MQNPLRRTAAVLMTILTLTGLFASPAMAASHTGSVTTTRCSFE